MNKYFILSITNQYFGATIYVNGIPVFTDNLRNEMDKTVHLNQFIIEGLNALRVVLHVPPDLLELPEEPLEFKFKIEQILVQSEESMTTSALLDQLVKHTSGQKFPLVLEATFDVSDAYGVYDWQLARAWNSQDLDREGVLRLAGELFRVKILGLLFRF